jgi:hypothetical protein
MIHLDYCLRCNTLTYVGWDVQAQHDSQAIQALLPEIKVLCRQCISAELKRVRATN